MTHPPDALHAHPDTRIDQALNTLRTAAPPSGLEQRIAARIATAAEARSVTTSPFAARAASPLAVSLNSRLAVILNAVKDLRIWLAPATRYALAAASLAILAALSFFVIHTHHPTPTQSPTSASVLPLQPSARNPSASASLDSAELQPHGNAPVGSPALAAEGASAAANTLVPRGFSLGSHSSVQRVGVLPPAPQPQPDPDAIALAETLAPSRPAPPEPLTQQELLALAVLRSGDQEEIAALNPAQREANLVTEELAFNRFFAPPKPEPPTPAATTGDKE